MRKQKTGKKYFRRCRKEGKFQQSFATEEQLENNSKIQFYIFVIRYTKRGLGKKLNLQTGQKKEEKMFYNFILFTPTPHRNNPAYATVKLDANIVITN